VVKLPLVVIVTFFISLSVQGQFKEVKRFTTSEGLPSNTVYRVMEDKYGFLWVCTNAGIARFDGKFFQNYTTEDGVPDNEVLQVDQEKNGKIWISSYRQEAAYFDEVQNRFINAKEDTLLRGLSGTGFSRLNALSNGGVLYFFQGKSTLFRNGTKTEYFLNYHEGGFFYLGDLCKDSLVGYTGNIRRPQSHTVPQKIDNRLVQINKRNEVIDSLFLFHGGTTNVLNYHGSVYMMIHGGRLIYRIRNIETHPLRCQIDSFHLKNASHVFSLCKNYLCANTLDGTSDIYDIRTGKFLFSISGNYMVNSVYEDHDGSLWLSTREHGLVYCKIPAFSDIPRNKELDFHSIHSFIRFSPQHYFVGIDNNGVVEYNHGKTKVHELGKFRYPGIVHTLLNVRDKVYSFSEHSGMINFTKAIFDWKVMTNNLNYKRVQLLPDSNILLCGQGRLDWLDTRNDSLHVHRYTIILNTCAALNKNLVYTGSTDGLRIVRNLTDMQRPPIQDSIIYTRITDLAIDQDSVLWVATSQEGVYGYKDGKILVKLKQHNGLISNMINYITVDAGNRLWVASSFGLSRITFKNNYTQYDIQSITQLDGLASNDVHNFFIDNDSIFVVTSQGISGMPLTIALPVPDIPIQLTAISVNQKPKSILSSYELKYNENQLSLHFAGIEIGGHFAQIEYRLGETKKWTLLDGNTLNLNLQSGTHVVEVRSVDVNGNRGKSIRTLQFHIATPFWKTLWFWLITLGGIQLYIGYGFYKRARTKQRVKHEQDQARIRLASLEQQASTALINPHFIFNALNGLQHYIVAADHQHTNKYLTKLSTLIRKSFELAQHAFVSLEDELHNLEQYVQLEQQRHTPTFQFQLDLDAKIDPYECMIPSMLLQPLIENAIWHGKLAANPEGKLRITITRKPEGNQFIISDNGIGLEKSKALKQSNHKSKGLRLIENRLAALSEICGQEIKFVYTIPYPNHELPGHQVEFILPFHLYERWKNIEMPSPFTKPT
jgi:hypothetical protein